MKGKIFLIGFFFVAIIAQAQSLATLQSETKKLYTSFNDIDLEAIAASLCSDKSKDEVYTELDKYFLSEDSKFRYVLSSIKYDYSPFSTKDGKTTSTITFRNVIRITYFKKIDVAAVQASLKEKFHPQSILYQKERNAYLIVYTAKLLAIADGKDNWKYAFLDNTLPKSISEDCLKDIKN